MSHYLHKLVSGIVTIKRNGKEEHLAIDGGFVEVTEKEVTILADFALHAREASAAQAEEAKRNAEKAIKENKGKDINIATLQDEFRRAILQLKLSQKNHAH